MKNINKLLISISFVLATLFVSNFVYADTISDIMLIDKNGSVIYINPTNLEKHTITTIDDLKKLIKGDNEDQNENLNQNTTTVTPDKTSNNTDDTTTVVVDTEIKDVAPFSDETQTPVITDTTDNRKLLNVDDMNTLLNKQRVDNNLSTLNVDKSLIKTAEQRCYNMIDTSNTADRSNGKIMSSIKSNGSTATLATEILYWSSASSLPTNAVDWWMDEPKYHKSNILKASFKNMGSAICKSLMSKIYFVTVFSN